MKAAIGLLAVLAVAAGGSYHSDEERLEEQWHKWDEDVRAAGLDPAYIHKYVLSDGRVVLIDSREHKLYIFDPYGQLLYEVYQK